MKLLLDFLPIVIFFAVFKIYDDIYLATVVLIIATALQVGFTWWRHGKVEKMPLIALGLLVVFGGITLLLHDEIYLKWKVTVVNALFGLVFLGSQVIGQKTLIERMMGHAMDLPHNVWQRLNAAWAVFFLLMAGLNLIVAYSVDTATWVDFKLWGLLGLTLAFVVLQGIYLSRYISEPEPGEPKQGE